MHHKYCMSSSYYRSIKLSVTSISIKGRYVWPSLRCTHNKKTGDVASRSSVCSLSGVSPLGNSPWRTREAGQSSRTGCLPPPLSYTSHSDWDPCRISEIISDTSVSPSLISAGIECKETSPVPCAWIVEMWSDRCVHGTSQLACLPTTLCVSACSVPVNAICLYL